MHLPFGIYGECQYHRYQTECYHLQKIISMTRFKFIFIDNEIQSMFNLTPKTPWQKINQQQRINRDRHCILRNKIPSVSTNLKPEQYVKEEEKILWLTHIEVAAKAMPIFVCVVIGINQAIDRLQAAESFRNKHSV